MKGGHGLSKPGEGGIVSSPWCRSVFSNCEWDAPSLRGPGGTRESQVLFPQDVPKIIFIDADQEGRPMLLPTRNRFFFFLVSGKRSGKQRKFERLVSGGYVLNC